MPSSIPDPDTPDDRPEATDEPAPPAFALPWDDTPYHEPPRPPSSARSPHRSTRSAPTREDRERRRTDAIVLALAVIGALIGLRASGHPTLYPAVDAVLRMTLGFGVTLAASQARRWSLLLLAGLAAAMSATAIGAVPAWAALALALALVLFDYRRRAFTALVGLLAVTALLHLPASAAPAVTVIGGSAAVVPVLVSAYRVQRRAMRHRLRVGVAVAAGSAALVVVGFGVAVVIGGSHADRGLAEARAGLKAARAGDDEATGQHLQTATDEFSAAETTFSAWYVQPSRLFPVLSAHTDALVHLSAAGHDLALSARDASGRANYRSIDVVDGRIDTARIASLAGPLDDVHRALDRATDRTNEIDTGWLLAPLASRVRGLRHEIATATDETETAQQAVAVAPGLLGDTGVRRYFIAFTTPAESRGLGGFMGNWAELTADHGKLSLTRSGRSSDLAARPDEPPRTLDAPADYLARYGAFHPEDDLRDVTLSPDFPSVAAAIESVYPQTAGGSPVDGVLALDPYAIAAMLEITGPVKVDGLDQPLTADNAADYLLRGQYTQFDQADQRAERIDVLDEAGHKTFDAFLRTKSLRPARLANVFGPIVAQHRFVMMANHPEEEALVQRVGLAGAFPDRGTGDFVSVVTQNAGNNKIDTFLHRAITYDTSFDPNTGAVDATVTVDLHNDAPSSGLPAYVIRNRADSHQPDGANWTWFNLYTPHVLAAATVDGQPLAMGGKSEFGLHVYQAYLPVPSGGDATVVLHLEGQVAPSSSYRLGWYQQPTVNPDTLTVTVTPARPWRAPGQHGGEAVSAELDPGQDGYQLELAPD